MDAVSPFFALPEVPVKEKMLSIITPVYNRKDLITETLDSILNQTRTDWECVVVDDHSDDGTVQIAEDYAKKDSRIKLFRRPDSMQKGASACRNYGFRHAEGEYIYFFDSDDLLAPEFIGTFLPPLENDPELDFVNFRFNRFQKDPKRISRVSLRKPPEISFIEAFAGFQMTFNTGCFFWRRTLLDRVPGQWREDIAYGEDQEYYFRLLHEARGGISIDNPVLNYYRRNQNSICRNLRHDSSTLRDIYEGYKSKIVTAIRYHDGENVQKALSKSLARQMRRAFYFGDLDYLAKFIQLSEQLAATPNVKKRIDRMRRHPLWGICLYRPFFLFAGFLNRLFTRRRK